MHKVHIKAQTLYVGRELKQTNHEDSPDLHVKGIYYQNNQNMPTLVFWGRDFAVFAE